MVTFHSLEDKIVKDFGKIMSGKATSTNRYGANFNTRASLIPLNKRPVIATFDEIRKKEQDLQN